MVAFFDSSLLVSALVEAHPRHERAFPYLDRVHTGDAEMAVSAHALAELYSTLTVLPVSPQIPPRHAWTIVQEEVRAVATIVPLEVADYEAVLARMADLSLASGAVYDGLHVRAAEKIGADELLTCNGRDFRRMPPEDPTRLVVV